MIYDAIVIGAGINGLMAAHCLRRRHPDARIAVLERFPGPASNHASSHGLIRITRSVYPTVSEVKGMFCTLEEWRILEEELGGKLIHFRPMCLYGNSNGAISDYVDVISKVKADTPSLDVRQIDVSEARRLYPQFRFDNDSLVLDDRTAGTIFAAETIRRLVESLVGAGVEIHYNTRVGSFERSSDGYSVCTDVGDLRCRQLVVAAGPWINQLVTCPPGRIKPMRQTVAYVGVKGLPTGTSIGEFPPWAHMGSGTNPIHYGLPSHGGQGLKIARHVTAGPVSEIDENDLAVDTSAALELVNFVRKHFVVSEVELLETEHCMYTCGEADKFIVDWLDESRRGVVVGSGSGHMFKWAPFIARVVTDMLTDGKPGDDEAHALLPTWSLDSNPAP